jgi:hypothetical protein
MFDFKIFGDMNHCVTSVVEKMTCTLQRLRHAETRARTRRDEGLWEAGELAVPRCSTLSRDLLPVSLSHHHGHSFHLSTPVPLLHDSGLLDFSKLKIGIDKKSKSFSFFCCSLYSGQLGFFIKK